jgi:hypothetical protein
MKEDTQRVRARSARVERLWQSRCDELPLSVGTIGCRREIIHPAEWTYFPLACPPFSDSFLYGFRLAAIRKPAMRLRIPDEEKFR